MRTRLRDQRARHPADTLDVDRVRSHFDFPDLGRVVTNNAASTQPPRELAALLMRLTKGYENVHRGQSVASQQMTELFEASYDTFAQWLNAPSRRTIATYRNTTEAINAVMYSLLTEFRDGDNVVTTMLEHNSDFVPWYAMCREILPRFGRHVECRIARFDHRTGELDLDHLAVLVDHQTKLVCVTGASNFLGTKPPLTLIRAIADGSGYRRDDGSSGSLLLVDAAQLVPSSYVDVQRLDVDYLAFSCHKVLAPFGVGVLYAKERLLAQARPFLYGGDMIAAGRVAPDQVEYNDLPWKYAAGTPNILGVIVSARALRLLLDLVGVDGSTRWFTSTAPLPAPLVAETMDRVRPAHGRADRSGDVRSDVDRRAHLLRAGGRLAAIAAAGVQRGGCRPVRPGRGPGPRGCRGSGGLSLRDAGPPRPRHEPSRQLSAELRALQQSATREAAVDRVHCDDEARQVMTFADLGYQRLRTRALWFN